MRFHLLQSKAIFSPASTSWISLKRKKNIIYTFCNRLPAFKLPGKTDCRSHFSLSSKLCHPRTAKTGKNRTRLAILCVGFKMDFLPCKLMQKYHTLLNNLWSPTDWFLLNFRLRSISGPIFERILFHKFLTQKWHEIFWIFTLVKVQLRSVLLRSLEEIAQPLEGRKIIQYNYF